MVPLSESTTGARWWVQRNRSDGRLGARGFLLSGTEPVEAPPETGTPGASAGTLAPVMQDTWVTAVAAERVEALSSRDVTAAGRLAEALAAFHEAAGRVELFNRRLRIADEANLQRVGAADRQRRVDEARRALFGAMQGGPAATPLMAALDIVGAREGIRFRARRGRTPGGEDKLGVRQIPQASGVRCRDVKLPRRGWWRGDSGALLAYRREDGAPVALVPNAAGYREHKPGTGRSQRLDAQRAGAPGADGVEFRPGAAARAEGRRLRSPAVRRPAGRGPPRSLRRGGAAGGSPLGHAGAPARRCDRAGATLRGYRAADGGVSGAVVLPHLRLRPGPRPPRRSSR